MRNICRAAAKQDESDWSDWFVHSTEILSPDYKKTVWLRTMGARTRRAFFAFDGEEAYSAEAEGASGSALLALRDFFVGFSAGASTSGIGTTRSTNSM